MRNDHDPLKIAFDLLPFDVYVVDMETRELVFINRSLREALGGGPAAGQPCWEAVYGRDSPCDHCRIAALARVQNRSPDHAEMFDLYHEARETWFYLTEKCLRWADGRLVKCSFAADISQLKSAQNSLVEAHAELAIHTREIRTISITDHLTGAYTRRHLDEVLQTEVSRAARSGHGFVVALCDLDKFKSVNDTYGHAAGDRLLIETVRLLKSQIRKIDVVGRWGGEEFVLVFPEIDLAGGRAATEKVRAAIAAFDFGEVGPRSASFGVAAYRRGESAEQLVDRADKALYRAKSGGRNRVES